MEEDCEIICPHCWQAFSIRLDLSVSGQRFVYDCEICCNPLEVNYAVEHGRVVACDAVSLDQ